LPDPAPEGAGTVAETTVSAATAEESHS